MGIFRFPKFIYHLQSIKIIFRSGNHPHNQWKSNSYINWSLKLHLGLHGVTRVTVFIIPYKNEDSRANSFSYNIFHCQFQFFFAIIWKIFYYLEHDKNVITHSYNILSIWMLLTVTLCILLESCLKESGRCKWYNCRCIIILLGFNTFLCRFSN